MHPPRRSKKDAARRRFDRWASRYESDRISRLIATPQQEALAALELGPGDRLLDVGCGTGAAVRTAAAVVERAVGVDLSPEMVAPDPERAVAEMARVLAPGGRIVFGDPTADRVATRVVDAILRRFQRDHVRFYRAAKLERFLTDAGFSSVSSRRLWNGGYAIVTGIKD